MSSFLNFFWYLKAIDSELVRNKILALLIQSTIHVNQELKTGLISPYYEPEKAIRFYLELLDEPISESFVNNSYFLDSLVNLAARYNLKDLLVSNWRSITHIQFSEFEPKQLWQNFLYRSTEGELKSRFPNQTQSWELLVKESQIIDENSVPTGLKKYPQFLPFFLLVYPHRFRPNLINFFDNQLETKTAQ